jgi:hypothetical protein
MVFRVVGLILLIACSACQSGKIPCPEIKFAKVKESKLKKGTRYTAAPSRMMASTKPLPSQEHHKQQVDLERLKSSRTTGKQMLEQYGTVEEWDCPSPSGKKKYSKVTKENIKKNEKKMREHLKHRNSADSVSAAPVNAY